MARSSRGAARVERMLDSATRAAIAEVRPALMKAGNNLADTMRHLAPDDPATSAPDLKTSIAVTGPGETTPPYSQPGGATVAKNNQVLVTAGNRAVRYAHLVEYGTTKARAQPFFWPAFRLGRKKLASAIKRAIGKAVRKGANNGA